MTTIADQSDIALWPWQVWVVGGCLLGLGWLVWSILRTPIEDVDASGLDQLDGVGEHCSHQGCARRCHLPRPRRARRPVPHRGDAAVSHQPNCTRTHQVSDSPCGKKHIPGALCDYCGQATPLDGSACPDCWTPIPENLADAKALLALGGLSVGTPRYAVPCIYCGMEHANGTACPDVYPPGTRWDQ